jgi:hypothetical protein
VDIANKEKSPTAQIPAIVQMYKQTYNVIDLKAPINDSDNYDITCSFVTGNNGYSPSPATSGKTPVLANACKLQWDLSSYNPGNIPRFSVSMWVLSSAGAVRVPLDFILEVIGGTPVVFRGRTIQDGGIVPAVVTGASPEWASCVCNRWQVRGYVGGGRLLSLWPIGVLIWRCWNKQSVRAPLARSSCY